MSSAKFTNQNDFFRMGGRPLPAPSPAPRLALEQQQVQLVQQEQMEQMLEEARCTVAGLHP
jgi:hypothetical protein